MKWEAGKKYEVRAGREAWVLRTDAEGDPPIQGFVSDGHGKWVLQTWGVDGKAGFFSGGTLDLMPPKPKTAPRWIVLGDYQNRQFRAWLFDSESLAKSYAKWANGLLIGQHDIPEDWL